MKAEVVKLMPPQKKIPSKSPALLGLNSVRPSKPIISKSFCLSKPVCPRNINSSRSIRSSNVCQLRNVSPSKLVPPVCKPVYSSNVFPSKPVRPSNTIV